MEENKNLFDDLPDLPGNGEPEVIYVTESQNPGRETITIQNAFTTEERNDTEDKPS